MSPETNLTEFFLILPSEQGATCWARYPVHEGDTLSVLPPLDRAPPAFRLMSRKSKKLAEEVLGSTIRVKGDEVAYDGHWHPSRVQAKLFLDLWWKEPSGKKAEKETLPETVPPGEMYDVLIGWELPDDPSMEFRMKVKARSPLAPGDLRRKYTCLAVLTEEGAKKLRSLTSQPVLQGVLLTDSREIHKIVQRWDLPPVSEIPRLTWEAGESVFDGLLANSDLPPQKRRMIEILQIDFYHMGWVIPHYPQIQKEEVLKEIQTRLDALFS